MAGLFSLVGTTSNLGFLVDLIVSCMLLIDPEAKYCSSPEVFVRPPRVLFVELLVKRNILVPTSNDGFDGTFGFGIKNDPITVPTLSVNN